MMMTTNRGCIRILIALYSLGLVIVDEFLVGIPKQNVET